MTDYLLPLPTPWTPETLPEYIDRLSQFITKYQDIGEFVSVDRFVSIFPVEWGKDFSLETWLEIIVGEFKGELPDDFAEFMRLSRALPLVDKPSSVVDIVDRQSIDQPGQPTERLVYPGSQGTKKPRGGCSPEKNHELDAVIEYLEWITNLFGITTKTVMDVGAGVGHLAGELLKEGYSVVAIEGNEIHMQRCVENTAGMAHIQCIDKFINNESDLHFISEPCISVSLHGCGDLSINNVRHFVSYDNVKLLLDVPCCYNRLSQDSFPLSKLFREKNVQLSKSLRQHASQCVDQWNVKKTISLTIQKHFYRAVLEVLFQRHGIYAGVSNGYMLRQKDRVYQSGFKAYVTAVVERNGLPETLIEETGIIDEYKVESMYPAVCLRAMCAAVVESLLVLDRWIYVKENLSDGHVILHKLFDSDISPRRWAIVAVR